MCPRNMKNVQFSALALDVDVFGAASRIYPVLVWDEDGATLIDAGYPGTFAQLRAAVEREIRSFGRVDRVVLTHQDWDHIGTVPDIIQALKGQVQILAHTAEKPYLEGVIPHCKLTPQWIAARIQALPAPMRENAAEVFANLPRFQVSHALQDGEVLPVHGGIEVIHVPGHTPGNVCLYVRSKRLLIAGDQLRVVDGALVGPAAEHTPDMVAARESLKKLLKYDIESVACYHGGVYTANAAARISELAM